MMFCMKCGNQIDEDDKFCPGCGSLNDGYVPQEQCQQESVVPQEQCQQESALPQEQCQQERVVTQEQCQQESVVPQEQCQQESVVPQEQCQQEIAVPQEQCQQEESAVPQEQYQPQGAAPYTDYALPRSGFDWGNGVKAYIVISAAVGVIGVILMFYLSMVFESLSEHYRSGGSDGETLGIYSRIIMLGFRYLDISAEGLRKFMIISGIIAILDMLNIMFLFAAKMRIFFYTHITVVVLWLILLFISEIGRIMMEYIGFMAFLYLLFAAAVGVSILYLVIRNYWKYMR